MKVALFADDFDPSAGGGFTITADITSAVIREARKQGLPLTVYSYASQAATLDSVRITPLATPRRRRIRRAFPALSARLLPLMRRARLTRNPKPSTDNALNRQLRRDGVDLVISTTPFMPGVECRYVMPVWDLAHRLHPHWPEVSASGEWQRRERLYAALLPGAERIIVGTHAGASQVQQCYGVPGERFVFLPHPTPTFALRAASDPPPPPPLPHRYIFYPAQFWMHKNHAIVLEALHSCPGARELHVVFSGADQGYRHEILKLAARFGVRDRMHMPGLVTRDQLVAYYRHAVALTYASLLGPENLPPLEAFALSCPVIAARVPGADEQLGDAALLFDPRRADSMCAALEKMIGDPNLRASLIARGRARARAFTAADYAAGLIEMVNTLR